MRAPEDKYICYYHLIFHHRCENNYLAKVSSCSLPTIGDIVGVVGAVGPIAKVEASSIVGLDRLEEVVEVGITPTGAVGVLNSWAPIELDWRFSEMSAITEQSDASLHGIF